MVIELMEGGGYRCGYCEVTIDGSGALGRQLHPYYNIKLRNNKNGDNMFNTSIGMTYLALK